MENAKLTPTPPRLTLAIPTYNRWSYLVSVLDEASSQLSRLGARRPLVELLVIDNCSTDQTEEGIQKYVSAGTLRYVRNPKNYGGDYNFTLCVEHAQGDYVWIFGDDDVLADSALERALQLLDRERPGLLIGAGPVAVDQRYSDYRSAVSALIWKDLLFPLKHTLITANIFDRTLFDLRFAREKGFTSYGHMYALLVECFRKPHPVVVVSDRAPLYHVRELRADFEVYPAKLKQKQKRYVIRLTRELRLRVARGLFFLGFNVIFEGRTLLEVVYMKYFKRFRKTA